MAVYADVHTSMGAFRFTLFANQVPHTVANFVGLATGTKAWVDPKTGENSHAPFYNGLTFHRVIEDFMIQTGCPLGQGTGGPGYKFADEFHPELRHDSAGIVSMANSGPDTNGSQFFITHKPTPWLNPRWVTFCANFKRRSVRCQSDFHCKILARRYPQWSKGPARCNRKVYKGHSVFGKVVHGLEVVYAIGKVKRNSRNKPRQPILLRKITIKRASRWSRAWLRRKP